MSPEENKAVVRRYFAEVLGGRNFEALDELLDPGYRNLSAFGDPIDRDTFRDLLGTTPGMAYTIDDMTAEGDEVMVRGSVRMIRRGQPFEARVLAFFRLSNGKIVEDEPMMNPSMSELARRFGMPVEVED